MLELALHSFLKKGSGPVAQAGEIVQSVKTMAPIGKDTKHKEILWPLRLCYSPDHSEHNWLPASSMLGSKHQITRIRWARRTQDSQ